MPDDWPQPVVLDDDVGPLRDGHELRSFGAPIIEPYLRSHSRERLQESRKSRNFFCS